MTNFEECVLAGNPIMESYPRQCNHLGTNFTENVGNIIEKQDLIRVSSPQPNATITSPLVVKGEARGTWFFEASFPITIVNWDGLIIGEGIAQADGEWMTEEFVPFTATVTYTFASTTPYNRGSIILKKDNPSGEPQFDDALEYPIKLQ